VKVKKKIKTFYLFILSQTMLKLHKEDKFVKFSWMFLGATIIES